MAIRDSNPVEFTHREGSIPSSGISNNPNDHVVFAASVFFASLFVVPGTVLAAKSTVPSFLMRTSSSAMGGEPRERSRRISLLSS